MLTKTSEALQTNATEERVTFQRAPGRHRGGFSKPARVANHTGSFSLDGIAMVYGSPSQLYSIDELLDGYQPGDAMGYASSWDFKMFQAYIADGGATPATLEVRQQQAEHDAHISEALKSFLDREPRPTLVGVMGGHSLGRADKAYIAVASLGSHLTRLGYLVVTGGGPGAMEAAHVGAAFAHAPAGELERALAILAGQPSLPLLENILDSNGTIVGGREEDWNAMRLWMNAALEAKAVLTDPPAESLAIPTWLYGNEPTIPFATHYAKYFQNSIREEALVTQSRAGIIYAQGGGGTLREIFEDAEQNYYAADAAAFTPMIFFDPDQYWERDAEYDANGRPKIKGVKIDEVLRRMFTYARWRKNDAPACLAKLLFTVDYDKIDTVLKAHAPIATRNLAFGLAAAPLDSAVFL